MDTNITPDKENLEPSVNNEDFDGLSSKYIVFRKIKLSMIQIIYLQMDHWIWIVLGKKRRKRKLRKSLSAWMNWKIIYQIFLPMEMKVV